MKLSGFVASVAAALLAAALAMPSAALAQRATAGTPNGSSEFGVNRDGTRPPTAAATSAASAAAAKAITKEQYAKGAKDGPAIIAAAGIQCTPDQIYWKGTASDPKTKAESNAYEVSCKEGLGYFLTKSSVDQKSAAFDCLAIAAAGKQNCILPGNADPKHGLGMIAQAGGRSCDVKAADYVGVDSKTGEVFYELACTSGAGFRMGVSGPKTSFISCLTLSESSQACKLTTKEESYAVLTPALQASGKACPVKAVRYVGSSPDKSDNYYEIGCASGPGFMLNVSPDLAYKTALDCTKAQGIAGGCKLTDITVAETADAATYTRLAGQAGFPCQVSKYRFIGTDKQNREVVELACADHPDGGVALFDEKGKSTVYDCVRAGALAQECKFSQASLVYPKYDVALSAKGKGSCKVAGARYIGSSAQADYVETACADGLPGWVIAFSSGTDHASDVLTCRQASNSGSPCQLPTNLKGNGG